MNGEFLGRIRDFASQYGHDIVVDGMKWRYYRLGVGRPIFWLTGGLRRRLPPAATDAKAPGPAEAGDLTTQD